MKNIKLFYMETCPHCKRAFNFIKQIKEENSIFKDIEIEQIEENKQSEIAKTFDYYYVPCFYVDGVKVHEGEIEKTDVEKVFSLALAK